LARTGAVLFILPLGCTAKALRCKKNSHAQRRNETQRRF